MILSAALCHVCQQWTAGFERLFCHSSQHSCAPSIFWWLATLVIATSCGPSDRTTCWSLLQRSASFWLGLMTLSVCLNCLTVLNTGSLSVRVQIETFLPVARAKVPALITAQISPLRAVWIQPGTSLWEIGQNTSLNGSARITPNRLTY